MSIAILSPKTRLSILLFLCAALLANQGRATAADAPSGEIEQARGTTHLPVLVPGGDLAEKALRLSPGNPSRQERREALRRLDTIAARIRAVLPAGATTQESLEVVNRMLFEQEGFRGTMGLEDPRSLSIEALLDEKKGTCVSLVILYLSVLDRLGIPAEAAATPVHLFVRIESATGTLNVETLEGGRLLTEEDYRRRNRMTDGSIERGIFMKALPRAAVLAHLLSNRGVISARAGRHRRAMRDFREALNLKFRQILPPS